jgi:ribosomal protein S3
MNSRQIPTQLYPNINKQIAGPFFSYFQSADFIASEMCKQLQQRKNPRQVLSKVINDAKMLLMSQHSQLSTGSLDSSSFEIKSASKIKGIRIALSGCLGRKGGMAKTLWKQIGTVPAHVYSEAVDFAVTSATTKLGQIGIRVLVCFI